MSSLPIHSRDGNTDSNDSFLSHLPHWIQALCSNFRRKHAALSFETDILRDPARRQLYTDFSVLSNKPHRGSFQELCRYQGAGTRQISLTKSDEDSWCLCLDSLWRQMERNHQTGLQIFVLSVQSPDIGRALSFMEKMFSSRSRLQRLALTPQQLVVIEATLKWRLEKSWVLEISNILKERHQSLEAATWKHWCLPRAPDPFERQLKVSRTSLSFVYPTNDTIEEFITDSRVYVFRSFAKSPRIERADIIIFRDEESGARKVLILSESPKALPEFLRKEGKEMDAPPDQNMLLQIFSAVVDHMRTQYTCFMNKAADDLLQTAIDGRIYPSGSKIHQFLHLDDCRRSVIRTCDENERNISLCLKLIERPVAQDQDDWTENINGFVAELERTRKDLANLESIIELARKTTREQLELAQIRRTSVLTVLAGLYIPMSFITSFFGMNINPLTKDGSVTYWRNTTESGEWSNRTIVTDNENHSFELNTYWAVSIPLTFGTILLPLISGALLRWSLQFASENKRWWRAIVALVSLALLETVGIVAATDVPMMKYECRDMDEFYENYEWIYEEFSGSDAFIVEIYNYSTVVALYMLCLFAFVFFWNFFHAAQRKDWWGMLYWLIQSTLYLLIMFLPHAFLVWQWILVCQYENLYLFLCYGGGVVYWFLHGLGWLLRPQWYYRWDERMLGQEN